MIIYDIDNKDSINSIALREAILTFRFEDAFYLVSKFITKRHIKQLHLNIMEHKSNNKQTIDLAPRGFGKSTVGDVDYCITKILREPDIRIMIGSKTQGQAEAFLKEIRTHFEQNEDLINIFGNLKGDKWTDKEFTVSTRKVIKKEATVTALGASGAVVSKHFDVIIGDDLVGFENARTGTQRKKLNDWFYNALLPTLEPHGEFHVLGTRYHPLDLYNDLILSKNYSLSVQKAINKVDYKKFIEDNPDIDEDVYMDYMEQYKEGEEFSLWEDKFNLKKLKTIKGEAGVITFAMQYQNETDLAKGTIFKAEYFNYYEEWEYFNNNQGVRVKVLNAEGKAEWKPVRVFFGCDLAISTKTTADYFVLCVIGVDADNNIYVLNYVKQRLSFNNQFNTIMVYGMDKFPMVECIGIESVAYQSSLAQELKRSSTLPIKELNTTTDKVTRANRRSALFENGKVYFRDNMQDLEECLLLFPDVEHDDLFDGLELSITASDKANKVRVLDRSNFRI